VSLLDQCASASTGEVTEESVCQTLGLAGSRRTSELLQAAAKQDTAKALSVFESLYAEGKDLSALFDELSALCRDLLVLKAAPKSGVSMLSGIADEGQALELEKLFTPAELLRDLTLVQAAKSAVGKNADARVASELCLMQLCEPSLTMDAQSLAARISKVEAQLASGSFVSQKPAPKKDADDEFADDRPPFPDDADDPLAGSLPPPEPEKPAQPSSSKTPDAAQEELERRWPELAASLREGLGVRERGFFAPGGPVRPVLAGDVLTLTAPSQFVLDIIKNPNVQALAAEKASAFLGRSVRVQFALAGQTNAAGKDPMDALVALGQAHGDIFTIK